MTVFYIPDETDRRLFPGDPAPMFAQRTGISPAYAFAAAAGRYIVLCFFGSAGDSRARAALDAVLARPDLFNDRRASFFGVSTDPEDEAFGRISDLIPGYRYFRDFDRRICRMYGVSLSASDRATGAAEIAGQWVVIDPSMRIITSVPFRDDGRDVTQVLTTLGAAPPPDRCTGTTLPAPVLIIPRVLEPELCAHLIDLVREACRPSESTSRTGHGSSDRRSLPGRFAEIEDEELIGQLQIRFRRRVMSEIRRAYHFIPTAMDRYVVTFDSVGHENTFSRRDTSGSSEAVRSFAVSVNLNDDFDGGDVSFPEYGHSSYRAPVGGALVHSSSVVHQASRVTRGHRYAFQPLIFDRESRAAEWDSPTPVPPVIHGEARGGRVHFGSFEFSRAEVKPWQGTI